MPTGSKRRCVQVRINARDLGFRNTFGQGGEPTFRLPFLCVLAPDSLAAIRRQDTNHHGGILGDEDLVNHGTVDAADRLRERHNYVLTSPAYRAQYASNRMGSGEAPYELTRGIAEQQGHICGP